MPMTSRPIGPEDHNIHQKRLRLLNQRRSLLGCLVATLARRLPARRLRLLARALDGTRFPEMDLVILT